MSMREERLMQIILAPHASEKTARLEEAAGQVCFKVLKDATKLEIKQAVELSFNVKVSAVTVAIQNGKQKRLGRFVGQRQDWKKAYVTLADGQTIDFVGGA